MQHNKVILFFILVLSTVQANAFDGFLLPMKEQEARKLAKQNPKAQPPKPDAKPVARPKAPAVKPAPKVVVAPRPSRIPRTQKDFSEAFAAEYKKIAIRINKSGLWKVPEGRPYFSTDSKFWEARVVTKPVNGRPGYIGELYILPHYRNPQNIVDALLDLEGKKAIIDCNASLDYFIQRALINLMGVAGYKQHWAAVLSFYKNEIAIGKFSDALALYKPASGKRTVGVGFVDYITNFKYEIVHPKGAFKAQNVVCTRMDGTTPYYVGVGPFFLQERSEAEIVDDLYNQVMKPIAPDTWGGAGPTLKSAQLFQKSFSCRPLYNDQRRRLQ